MKLVVKLPFANYLVGDEITDPEKVAEIVAGDHQHNVLKVSVTAADLAVAAKPPKTK